MINLQAVLLATLTVAPLPSTVAQQSANSPELLSTDCKLAEASLPADQARLFCQIAHSEEIPTKSTLEAIDTALATMQLSPSTSRFNRILLTRRAETLVWLGRDEAAEKAYVSLIATYPDDETTRISAISFLSQTELHKDEAADYWLDLIGRNPAAARRVEPEVLSRLVLGLPNQGQRNTNRALTLTDSLDGIGYDTHDAYIDSFVASLRFRERARGDDRDGALAALKQVRDPDTLAKFASNKAYREYWPTIAWEDAGRREVAWRTWFEALAKEAQGDIDRIGRFMAAIQPYVPAQSLIAVYEQPFMQGLAAEDKDTRSSYAAWVEPLANANLSVGDAVNAERIHKAAADAMSDQLGRLQLAMAAQHMTLLVELERHADAEAMLDEAFDNFRDARVSRTTLERLHTVTLRILASKGDIPTNAPSMVRMKQWLSYELIGAIDAFLLIDESDKARNALRRRLRQEDFYPEALAYLQPTDARNLTSTMKKRERLRSDLLSDRQLRASIDQRGRILPRHAVLLHNFALPLPTKETTSADAETEGSDLPSDM